MAVRSTMASLIARARLLINDPSAAIWTDQQVQDVLDQSRVEIRYAPLHPSPTYSGSSLQYLDYYHDLGDIEDDATLWQYRTIQVTPLTSEPIAGHFTFATTTLPPIYLIGKAYDLYRAAADLLERQAAQWALSFTINADGQTMARSQVLPALLSLAKTYRMQQKPVVLDMVRGDLSGNGVSALSLGPQEIDRIASGDGR